MKRSIGVVGVGQGLGLAASGGLEACNGKKERVWGPTEGGEEQQVEMGKEVKGNIYIYIYSNHQCEHKIK